MEINSIKHQTQLQHLRDVLATKEVVAFYTEAATEAAVDTLTIPIPDSDGLYILIAFLEIPESTYPSLDLLQLHATLPEELALANLSEIHLFISQVNNFLPLGNLCVVDNTICVRHIVPQARFDNIDTDLLLDLLNLFIHVLGEAETIIHQLNTGQIDHHKALAVFGEG